MWNRLSAKQRVVLVASVAAAALWTAVWVSPSDDVAVESQQEAAPTAAPVVSAPAQQAPETTAAAESQPAAEGQAAEQPQHTDHVTRAAPASEQQAKPVNEQALAAFREGMASDNSGTRIEALRQLDKDGTLEALPELLKSDLTRDPEVAPTLIQVTSQLAQRSPLRERGAAAEQMSSWLRSEGARDANDARGNVSMLVESLSSLNSPKTQGALIEVLHSEKLPLNVQTLAVDGLSHFTSPESKVALEQFREQLGKQQREGFDAELQREAEQATDRALARVSR